MSPLVLRAGNNADGYSRTPSEDKLFNTEAIIPPRPTISNLQWISGTQFVSPADMDVLSKLPRVTFIPCYFRAGPLTSAQSVDLIDPRRSE
jgi:hypothetical protein